MATARAAGPKLTRGPRKRASSDAAPERFATHKRRANWFQARASWPLREASATHVAAARRAARASLAAAPGMSAWEQAGPTNIGGRLTSLAVDPRDADVVFAGSAGGGVWRSRDAGRHWQPLWHDQDVLNVGALALDPSAPDVLYVATGEANLSADSYPGLGLFVTRDGGEHFERLASAEEHGLPWRVGALAVDPFDPLHLRLGGVSHGAGAPAGLFASGDSGLTWQRDLSLTPYETNCHAVVFHPRRRGVLFATLHERGARSGLWRSRDGGASWVQLVQGLPAPERFTRASLALAPSRPDTVWLLAADDRDHVLGVFVSRDWGSTWRDVTSRHFHGEGQMFYNNAIAVHPRDPDHVLCGGVDLHRTTDGGRTWRKVTRWDDERGGSRYAHSDHHALVMPSGAPGRVYDGNDGGLDLSEDGGTTWTNRSAGLAVTMFYDVDVAESDPRLYGGGAQDNGTLVTQSGNSDDFFELTGGDGGWLLIDPRDPGHVYSSSQYLTVNRRRRGRWRDVSPELSDDDEAPWMAYLVMHPRRSDVVYAGARRVWRTSDDGLTWEPLSASLDGSSITAIEVARADPRRLYVGTENGGIFRSRDGGRHWSGNLAGARLPGHTVTRLVTDPRDSGRIYAAVGGTQHSHVFRSVDGGAHWDDLDGGRLPDVALHALALPADAPGSLYACGDAGVFVSPDDGGTWLDLSANLPRVMCVDLVYHAATRSLFVATYGRSLWRLALA